MTTQSTTTDQDKPALVGAKTCLSIVFPDEATSPSLRTFLEWKSLGYFPQLKIGRRIFLDPVQVRKALEERFTLQATD